MPTLPELVFTLSGLMSATLPDTLADILDIPIAL